MIKYIIQRPVAVITIFTLLIVTGLLLLFRLPVSLLPDIDVPQIIVKVDYPDASAVVVEENVTKQVREALSTLEGLKHIGSESSNNLGLITLKFEYNTRMNLAYLAVNEKLDRLAGVLPRQLQRPEVIRVNTSDIPVLRLQVIPSSNAEYLEVSAFTEKVLKRRIEQIDGVSLVDISGMQQAVVTIQPDHEKLLALGLREEDMVTAIRQANREMGNLSVRDGQYRYFVKMANDLYNAAAIAALPIRLENGSVITIGQVARVNEAPETPNGYHFYNGQENLVITVHKQPDSRMSDVVQNIKALTQRFREDYPQIRFEMTQDQTYLLDAGIDNLYQDLLYGGALTILLLFLFLGNWTSPLLMSVNIPISLTITFIFFYLFDISFNIISLSGLALGIGMLIDNSIVVIDSITRKRKQGAGIEASAVQGTSDVIAPVISQVLTTVAVYAPLILLSGIAGALVSDQSIALTISLGVSLLVAFILTPLLYKILMKHTQASLKDDTRIFRSLSRAYHRMIGYIIRHRRICLIFTLLLMPAGIWLAGRIPVSALPHITSAEGIIRINWNEPIDAQQNLSRIKAIYAAAGKNARIFESEIGIRQFILQSGPNTLQWADIYFMCGNERERDSLYRRITAYINTQHPLAESEWTEAPNSFTQLFSTDEPYFEARFKPFAQTSIVAQQEAVQQLLAQFEKYPHAPGKSLRQEPSISIFPDYEKMALYNVSKQAVEDVLLLRFGNVAVSDIRQYGELKKIILQSSQDSLQERLSTGVQGAGGNQYPLYQLVTVREEKQPVHILADKNGTFQSLLFGADTKNIPRLLQQLASAAKTAGMEVEFSGQYFSNRDQLGTLWVIFLAVLLLLFFILAMQYESLIQPLIIMLTIPLGITGGMALLWAAGATLNVMSAIGFIVILGLIVDDPILKIETLNRLEKKYLEAGMVFDEALLEKMIHEAGDICLKPLLLVSLTTSIALVPVLFTSGIGNELQEPMALVIIGGLTFGTFFTTWFTPLAYWYYARWKHATVRRKGVIYTSSLKSTV